jgi:hypothetical protein
MVRLLARLLAAAIRQALWLFEWAKCSVTQGRGATPALEVPLAEVLQAAAPISQSERTRPNKTERANGEHTEIYKSEERTGESVTDFGRRRRATADSQADRYERVEVNRRCSNRRLARLLSRPLPLLLLPRRR